MFKERELEIITKPPIALRLDGVGFSRILSHFRKPRDERVHNALVSAAMEVVKRYNCEAAYITSDEINIFMLKNLPYSGRVEKLDSIIASIISATATKTLGIPLYFDCRIIKLNNTNEAIWYLLYRARVGFGNFIGSLLKCLGLNPREVPSILEQISILRSKGVSIEKEPKWKILGSSVLWATYEKEGYNPIEKKKVKVLRRKVIVVEGYETLLKYLISICELH